MPGIRNTPTQYGSVAIIFHWVMALIVIVMIIIGLYMVGLPIGLRKLQYYGWHKELGVLTLILVVLRVMWRFANVVPRLMPLLPFWEATIARMVHWIFYLLLGVLPLTGWLMSSAAGLPVSFFGLFVLPDLIAPNDGLRVLLKEFHQTLAYILIVFICLHILAALKHHFINKDDILRRMIP